jgi:hypothetical protein
MSNSPIEKFASKGDMQDCIARIRRAIVTLHEFQEYPPSLCMVACADVACFIASGLDVKCKELSEMVHKIYAETDVPPAARENMREHENSFEVIDTKGVGLPS